MRHRIDLIECRARYATNPEKGNPHWLRLAQKIDQGQIENWLEGTPGRIDTNGARVVLKATNAFGQVETTTVVVVSGASILTIFLSVFGATTTLAGVIGCLMPRRYKDRIKEKVKTGCGTCAHKCRRAWRERALSRRDTADSSPSVARLDKRSVEIVEIHPQARQEDS